MDAVSHVYVLPRCDTSLYASGDGYAKGSLVWTAKQVDNLRVRESFDVIEQRPTGIPYPEIHHTAERHEIMFDGIWDVGVTLLQRGAGVPSTGRNSQYILEIEWLDASLSGGSNQYTRTYYGAMLASQEVASRNANEFGVGVTLTAKYYE